MDIAIFKKDTDIVRGRYEKHLSLDDETHWEIIAEAKKLNLSLTLRMQDYYEDAKISFEELGSFMRELDTLAHKQYKDTDYVKTMLREIKSLAMKAKQKGKQLYIIAD